MPDTLADALPREIARVTAKKERWLQMAREHPEIAAGLRLSIAIMQYEIETAIRAAASGDVVAMLQAHQSLVDYDGKD